MLCILQKYKECVKEGIVDEVASLMLENKIKKGEKEGVKVNEEKLRSSIIKRNPLH